MTETTAKALAVKLMAWELPQDFSPDCFISFDRERATANGSWPVGTNLLTVAQAEQMFAYVLEGSPHAQAPELLADLREAAAMNTASQAVKKATALERELDKAKYYASVKRMEMLYHGTKFNWRLLKSAAIELGILPIEVFDANYGTVKAYHADVWMEAYAVEINPTPENPK